MAILLTLLVKMREVFIMRLWMEKMQWKLQCFMQGRYGQDRLSQHLCGAALILMVGAMFFPYVWLSVLAFFCIVWSVFRSLSKNVDKRGKEAAAYEKLLSKPSAAIKRYKRQWTERKTHRFFRCRCGAVVRVPKGRGKIEITCPKCKGQMIKHT